MNDATANVLEGVNDATHSATSKPVRPQSAGDELVGQDIGGHCPSVGPTVSAKYILGCCGLFALSNALQQCEQRYSLFGLFFLCWHPGVVFMCRELKGGVVGL